MKTPIPSSLTKRERAILRVTIEDYIETYHPVGSLFLKKQHSLNYSPATIRQVMANLESVGLLTHPHTSSGRVPTDNGYRYYVNELIEDDPGHHESFKDIEEALTEVSSNLDELMRATAILLAKISRLFGVVLVSAVHRSILTDIELIRLSSERVMVVLAMKSGMIRSVVLDLQLEVNERQLTWITQILKERLTGLTLEDIQKTIGQRLHDSEIYQHEIIQILVQEPEDHFSISENQSIFTSTVSELLNYPEFQEIPILQKTLEGLDSSYVKQFLTRHVGDRDKETLIGSENHDELLNHCSILTHRFKNNEFRGQLAIFGPTRLPYRAIKQILNNFSEILPNVC